MLSSKTRTGLSETIPNKTSPATPRVSKVSKGPAKSDSSSPSPLQNARHSIDRSPKTVDSKPVTDRRSPRPSTPDKTSRVLKGSELQAQLSALQDDLKKANERLASCEKERTQALDELKETKRAAEDANEKLSEALVAQKRAEESSEIEKFRADELEQAGIEAAQRREDEWQKEMESVRSQHASDVAALLTANGELHRAQQELAMVTEAKNTALSHADDAMKIAEMNAEKVEFLSNELARVKSLLDMKLEAESHESSELVKKLNSEIDSLKQELERSKVAEIKVVELEGVMESLKAELNDTKKAHSDSCASEDEWKKKATLLETQLEEVSLSQKSASESLASALKQLEGNNALLLEAETEAETLRAVVESLEASFAKYKEDLKEYSHLYETSKLEVAEMTKTIESLKSKLESVDEEKRQSMENEMLSASKIQNLLEEKSELIQSLEELKVEKEKSEAAGESLASALHEMSTEAREVKEKLTTAQAEHENAESQIGQLKLSMTVAEENYNVMINEAKIEIDTLRNTLEKSHTEIETLKEELIEKEESCVAAKQNSEAEIEALKRDWDKITEDSKAEWEGKEHGFMSTIKKYEEEVSYIQREVDRLKIYIKEKEEEAQVAKDDEVLLQNNLKQAEAEAISAKEVADKALGETLKLKDSLLDKENELQSILHENEELRCKEASARVKVQELSKLLEEATAKRNQENEELSNSEKDYDLLPKMDELVQKSMEERKFGETDAKMSSEGHNAEGVVCKAVAAKNNATAERNHENGNENTEEDAIEVDARSWDNCKINSKDVSPERDSHHETELESFEEEVDSRIDGENFDQINGSSETTDNGRISPSKQLKKKKPLLRKFGSLLKKKSSPK